MPVGDLGGRVARAGRRGHGALFQRRRSLAVCAFEERKPGTYEMRDGPVGSGRGRRVTWRMSRYDWYNGSVCLSLRRSVACSFPSPWRLRERERERGRAFIHYSFIATRVVVSCALSLSLSLSSFLFFPCSQRSSGLALLAVAGLAGRKQHQNETQ